MIIDGKAIAHEREASIKKRVLRLPKKPKLAIVLVGEDKPSQIYVNLKVKKAQELGIETRVVSEVSVAVADWADGIIVQLPCPNEEEIINKIPLEKDVDGLRVGSKFLPATVRAVLVILEKLEILDAARMTKGTWVIVGQGKLVGKPLADYLEKQGEQVIRCRSTTKNLREETLKGDVLVTATGVPNLIKANMVKPGAIVIDCGSPKPEIDPAVYQIAGAYTPVPGGVGPLTVVCLLENLLEAVKI